jgi:hypothetical protein
VWREEEREEGKEGRKEGRKEGNEIMNSTVHFFFSRVFQRSLCIL